jgi:hypothetical protein
MRRFRLGVKRRRTVTRSDKGFLASPFSDRPLTCSLRRDDNDFVVFCFAKPKDAQGFVEPFGGGAVPHGQPAVTLKSSGRPERVVRG